MIESGTGGGQLTIDRGSVFNTKDTVIQVKGRGTNILVDNATLKTQQLYCLIGRGKIVMTVKKGPLKKSGPPDFFVSIWRTAFLIYPKPASPEAISS